MLNFSEKFWTLGGLSGKSRSILRGCQSECEKDIVKNIPLQLTDILKIDINVIDN